MRGDTFDMGPLHDRNGFLLRDPATLRELGNLIPFVGFGVFSSPCLRPLRR